MKSKGNTQERNMKGKNWVFPYMERKKKSKFFLHTGINLMG